MLVEIAKKHNTDKHHGHNYIGAYEHHFNPLKEKEINLLEIGIGGDANPTAGGESLRMWKEFFPKGHIYGMDIYDKAAHKEERIHILKGSQDDVRFLNSIHASFDIIIDDGSHVQEHIIVSFFTLFPRLKKGGIYVIEDLQTAYWPKWTRGDSAMEMTKNLCDGLNHAERLNYAPNYFDKNISSVHFYHNIVFIYKGDNTYPSNIVTNNKPNTITG